jgi:hypothetical protein
MSNMLHKFCTWADSTGMQCTFAIGGGRIEDTTGTMWGAVAESAGLEKSRGVCCCTGVDGWDEEEFVGDGRERWELGLKKSVRTVTLRPCLGDRDEAEELVEEGRGKEICYGGFAWCGWRAGGGTGGRGVFGK